MTCWDCTHALRIESGERMLNFIAEYDTVICNTNMWNGRMFHWTDGIICDPHIVGDGCESYIARCCDA